MLLLTPFVCILFTNEHEPTHHCIVFFDSLLHIIPFINYDYKWLFTALHPTHTHSTHLKPHSRSFSLIEINHKWMAKTIGCMANDLYLDGKDENLYAFEIKIFMKKARNKKENDVGIDFNFFSASLSSLTLNGLNMFHCIHEWPYKRIKQTV